MEIKTDIHKNFVSLRISGELDAISAVTADEVFRNLISEKKFNLHIDFTGLDYISSAGIGVILSHQDEIYQNGGKIVFTGLSSKVMNVFQLLGLHQLFEILDSEAGVEASFV